MPFLVNKRLLVGFFVAPVSATVVFALWATDFNLPTTWEGICEGITTVLSIALIVAYVVTLVIGLPVWLIFKYFGWMNFWIVSIGAGIIPAVLLFLFCFWGSSSFSHAVELCNPTLLMIFAAGACTGITFWSISYGFKVSG